MAALEILGHAKEIAELIRTYNNMDLYQKIVDLRDEIINLSEDNLSLKERVRELEQQQVITSELVREGNVYYRPITDGKKLGPFCMTCWDGDRKLVNLILGFDEAREGETIRCGRCARQQA
jgi:hypothetical protein